MPQVDIRYSQDLKKLNLAKLFEEMEVVINQQDSTARDCKSRAYPAETYYHSHIYISILLLRKPHRDHQFMKSLQEKLITVIKKYLPKDCSYALELDFLSEYYFTEKT